MGAVYRRVRDAIGRFPSAECSGNVNRGNVIAFRMAANKGNNYEQSSTSIGE